MWGSLSSETRQRRLAGRQQTPKPDVRLTVDLARQAHTVAEHVVLGLVTGGFLGDGLVLNRRDDVGISFQRRLSARRGIPDRGDIELDSRVSGRTEVTCSLWCAGLRRFLLVRSAILGAALASLCSLVFGWVIALSIPIGLGVAIVSDQLSWREEQARLMGQMELFLRNTEYLTAR